MSDSPKTLKGLDALMSLTADRLRRLDQMGPALDLVRQYQDMMRPLHDSVRQHEETIRPVLEAARRQQETMRPFVEAAERQREMFRHFTDALPVNSPALALAGQIQIPQLQIAETFGKTMALNGVVDEAGRFSALTGRWRETLEGFGALSNVTASSAFADVQHFAESLRLSMPEFPALDPALFGSTLNADLLDAFERFRNHAEAVASDPEADVRNIEALVAEAEAVNAAAPAELRSKVNGYLLFLFLWLLDKAAEDPAKELIHNAIAALVLVLTTVVPPAAPPAPALPIPRIEIPAAPSRADATMVAEDWQVEGLPDIIRRAGGCAERGMLRFLNDGARNANTKQAYAAAVVKFMDWSEDRALELTGITPFVVRAYVKQMQREYAPATVRQHLVAIRLLFDHLVLAGALPVNPAASVRASPNMVKPQKGGATVLQPDEAGRLLASIDVSDRSGVRDRALVGLMLATRARVSAITTMDVKDYGVHDGQRWVRLSDSRGTRGVAVDETVQRALDAYLETAQIGRDEASPLWRTMTKQRAFSERRMTRVDVFRMIRRRARNAGIGAAANCDSLRVTGVNVGLSGAQMPANERGRQERGLTT